MGRLSCGTQVRALVIGSAARIRLTVLELGAAVQSLTVRRPGGGTVETVLGYATAGEYETGRDYLGAMIGRCANRIDHGRYAVDGVTHQVSCNEGSHSLHGGSTGWNARMWDVVRHTVDTLTLRLVSPDGEQGHPGRVEILVTYRVRGCRVEVTWEARTTRATVFAPTTHVYWNLGGAPGQGIGGHLLQVEADHVLLAGPDGVPRGGLRDVAAASLDLSALRPLEHFLGGQAPAEARASGGLDHSFDLRRPVGRGTTGVRHAAVLVNPDTGLRLDVGTDQEALQVYTANGFDGSMRDPTGRPLERHAGVALEPQVHPNAINAPVGEHPLLRPGEIRRGVVTWDVTFV